jgi:ribose 5-phosphate isomerase A
MSSPTSAAASRDPLVDAALTMVPDGAVVGLGSGRAATRFIKALGARVAGGLRVRGVPTSQATADLATSLRIPLATLAEIETIDVAIDGADEVDPQLNLIKGLGGALVREKVVAAAAREFIVLVGPEKIVSTLGQRGVLPLEVVPFALDFCRRQLEALGWPATQRQIGGQPFVSDNGNPILDCRIAPIPDAFTLEGQLRSIPGVVGTGLFLGMADAMLIDRGDHVEARRRPQH